jgi:arsenite oxidase large subunit
MTFKRHIGRLPIIPTDAKEHNVTCQFCIVGCGYKAYTWDINQQGGPAPSQNKFGVDLSKQQDAMTANWYAPSMYNIVKQDGKDVHIVIKPDHDCVVNSGLGSIRGARMAEESFSEARSTQQQRLTEPMVWRYGQMQPTSWDDALDLVARVTAAVIDSQGEDGLFVSAFDHGGAGGGYENTWGTGKLYFGAMKIKNIRIHNRPAYNSEVHATRDMGVANSTIAMRTLNSPTRSSQSEQTPSRPRPITSSTTGYPTCAGRWTRRMRSFRAKRIPPRE